MIYIQTLDYKWYPYIGSTLDEEEEIAKAFIEQIKLCITSQKISTWQPLSPKYLAYKRRKGLSLKMWESTKFLKESLTYSINGDVITIGWSTSLIHPKSKYPVYKIAKSLEYGTDVIPPRPLFREVLKTFQELIQEDESLPKVKSGVFTPKKESKGSESNFLQSIIKKSFKLFKKIIPNKLQKLFKRR